MAELDYDEADRLIRNCKTYNFGMWAADKLAHEVAPALLARVREIEAESKRWESAFEREFKEHEYWYERLDTLVYSLASVDEIGEWSSGNDPAYQLIDHINAKMHRLEAERDVALSTIAKVEALHVRAHAVFSWAQGGVRYEEPCPDCDGKAGVHGCGCWADSDIGYVCAECDRGSKDTVPWPCPTIRALGSVPSTGEGNE